MNDAQPPQLLGGCHGVAVWGGDCGELAGALDLLAGILAGRTPPGSAKQARMTRRLEMAREAFARAAREQQAVKHRALAAAVAQPQPDAAPMLVAPAQPGGSSLTATIDVKQAADLLRVTPQRIRVLLASGRITGRRGPRNVWEIDRGSTVAYRDRQARRRTTYASSREGGTTAQP